MKYELEFLYLAFQALPNSPRWLLNFVWSKGLPTSDSPLRSHTHKVEQGLGVLALRIKLLLFFVKNSAIKREWRNNFFSPCFVKLPSLIKSEQDNQINLLFSNRVSARGRKGRKDFGNEENGVYWPKPFSLFIHKTQALIRNLCVHVCRPSNGHKP